LFSVVDILIENMFLRRILPTTLRARVLSYALGAYKVFIEDVFVETSKTAHSIGNTKGLVPFLIVQSHWRATSPPSTSFNSPNTSNKIFEIAILFSVVDF
jgi:hypothetical protein